jgi:hypothetical protein
MPGGVAMAMLDCTSSAGAAAGLGGTVIAA